MKRKIIGHNYLHSHPMTEMRLNVDKDHVIVDREEWEEIVRYFRNYPEEVSKLDKTIFDINKH